MEMAILTACKMHEEAGDMDPLYQTPNLTVSLIYVFDRTTMNPCRSGESTTPNMLSCYPTYSVVLLHPIPPVPKSHVYRFGVSIGMLNEPRLLISPDSAATSST